jgi:hypothetical protein
MPVDFAKDFLSLQPTCAGCGNLDPDEDSNHESSFQHVCAAAGKGCESCALLRHAIVDCLPEVALIRTSAVYVIVRRSILRDFIEVVVRCEQPARTVVLDMFIAGGAQSYDIRAKHADISNRHLLPVEKYPDWGRNVRQYYFPC